MAERSAAQWFQSGPNIAPSSGMPCTQSGARGSPARNAPSISSRSWATSLPLAGAARASGRTITRAVSVTMIPAAALRPRRRCARSHSQTGQVVNTRMPAQSIAEKKGQSTRTQPTAIPPMRSPISRRSAALSRGPGTAPVARGASSSSAGTERTGSGSTRLKQHSLSGSASPVRWLSSAVKSRGDTPQPSPFPFGCDTLSRL